MGIIQKIKHKLFIPGEPITILGFNHSASAIRIYDGWIRYNNGLGQNTFRNENADIRTSKPYMFMGRFELPKLFMRFAGKTIEDFDEEGTKITSRESNIPYFDPSDGSYYIKIEPKYAPILDTPDAPESLIFPMDFETATGVTIEGKPIKQEVPTRMFGFIRDPILRYYKTNPEVYGVSADVALSAGLLRVKVQYWKTILIAVFAFLFGMAI